MNSRRKKDVALVGFVVILALGTFLIWFQAGDGQGSETTNFVASEEVIEGGYVKVGEVVEIAGTVNGDVKVVGGQVLIDGQINGNLLAIGAFVTVSGKISGDAQLIGGQIIVAGEFGENVTVGGMNVAVTNDAVISGKLLGVGSNVSLGGLITDDVKIGGRNMIVTSTIDGDVEAVVESLRISSKSHITGDLTYWSNKEVSVDDNAIVRGEIIRKAPQGFGAFIEALFGPSPAVMQPLLRFTSVLITLILGLFLISIFPTFTRHAVITLRTKHFQCLTTGFTALLLLPVVFGILVITIVGIPFGFVVLIASAIIFYIARIFVILLIGKLLLERVNRKSHEVWALVLGLALYSFLISLPLVGWAIAFFAVLIGLGATLIALKDYRKQNKESTPPTP